ncbi:MAG: hypothetical protein H7Y88_01480 [Phycisphaerales bacterium]|nr:hypothetical protein [Phycisphaerales bacterium]
MKPVTSLSAFVLCVAAGLPHSLDNAIAVMGQPEARATREGAARGTTDDLPIRRITLYRSGVGFFQREGTIDATEEVQLRFNIDQINDILKSMVLLDLDGGRIESVSYGSKDPLARRLGSFQVPIADNPAMPELLNRLRGSRVEVDTPGGTWTGTILGTEQRQVPGGERSGPMNAHFLTLVTDAGIKSVPVAEISSFRLLDKALAEELAKALGALAEQRAETSKSVDIRFAGEGARKVVVAYVHEMPVWKTSYRLILPEAEASKDGPTARPNEGSKPGAGGGSVSSGKAGESVLQGWAIVENTTDQDWTDVRLALVAGRPVSFQMDLYEPLYVYRPEIAVPTVAGVSPRQYQGGVNLGLMDKLADASDQAAQRESDGKQYAKRAGRGGTPPAPASAAAESGYMDGAELRLSRGLTGGEMVDYTAAAQAEAGLAGEVFQYELSNAVTIERQQSAMIPILSSNIPSRRVSIFNLSDGSAHPMRGVEITNPGPTEGVGPGLQLLPGPIAVFDGAAYAGDAQVSHIPPGDKRLLAYAVDLDVAVLTKPESTGTITKLRIVDGLLEQTVKQRSQVVYGFENKDRARGRTVLVEHPRLGDWQLVEPKKAVEETPAYYRFELELSPGGSGTLPVAQEHTEYQQIAVMSYDLPTITQFHREGKLSDSVLDAFRQIAAKQGAINDSRRAIEEIDRQSNVINQDQARIRNNMGTIDRNSDLYRRYMTKLTEQESQLEGLITQRAEAQKQLDDRQADLNAYLRELDVE